MARLALVATTIIGLVGIPSWVRAEGTGEPAPTAAPTTVAGPASPAQSGGAAADSPLSTEIAEEAARARSDLALVLLDMRDVSTHVREMLRDARKRGTRKQIACLDDALSRADVALRHARDSAGRATTAYARGDVEEARETRRRAHEWRASQRIAARDGAACAPPRPAARVAKTGTSVSVSVDPRVPRTD